MSKYDMTGIGLNLREIPDDNGSLRLVVLGLILDGPAHSAGVKQVSTAKHLVCFPFRWESCFYHNVFKPIMFHFLVHTSCTKLS